MLDKVKLTKLQDQFISDYQELANYCVGENVDSKTISQVVNNFSSIMTILKNLQN